MELLAISCQLLADFVRAGIGDVQDFRDLKVWQKSHLLVLDVYRLSRTFPKEERYGLTSQLRRSASSIPANIAEGCGRGSDADFSRFLYIAFGSANETEYHLVLARDLGFLSEQDCHNTIQTIQEVKRMTSSLLQRLKTSTNKSAARSTPD